MKKKLLTMLLLAFLSVGVVACSNEDQGKIGNSNQSEETSNAQLGSDKEGETTKKETEEPKAQTEAPKVQTEAPKAEITIERQVVFDQDGIIITATGIDLKGSFMGPEIKLLIENNSEKKLTVQARNVSVNGYMVDTSMSAEVSPGKKANDSLTITKSSIKECGIENIAYADFSFHIFNSDSWSDSFDTDMIHIETSCVNSYTQSYDDSGEVIYENNGIKIVSKGISEDASFMGTPLVLYIENNTEDAITIQARNVSINGFMVDQIFSCEIMPGKKAIDAVTFMKSDIEENQIKSIDKVEISFHIFKTDGWDTIQDTDPVTISFK